MFNKKYLTITFVNEKLLLKSMKLMFITVTMLTVFVLPILFLLIYKNRSDVFYGNVVQLSQYFFPFFCALLNVFILRNYTEHYNCEIYFLYSRSKICESVLILIIYLLELIVPLFVCVCIENAMIFEFIRVMCQCVLFSGLSYALMFITMSVPTSLSVIFIYLMISIYNMSDSANLFVFCSYEEMNFYNIMETSLWLLIPAIVLYIVGIIFNLFRSRRYINI